MGQVSYIQCLNPSCLKFAVLDCQSSDDIPSGSTADAVPDRPSRSLLNCTTPFAPILAHPINPSSSPSLTTLPPRSPRPFSSSLTSVKTLSSQHLTTVNLCLLLTVFTCLCLRFVFSTLRIGSLSTPTTLALHTNRLSSTHGAPRNVYSRLPMADARVRRSMEPTGAEGMRKGRRSVSPWVRR